MKQENLKMSIQALETMLVAKQDKMKELSQIMFENIDGMNTRWRTAVIQELNQVNLEITELTARLECQKQFISD